MSEAFNRIRTRYRRESPWKIFQRYSRSKMPDEGWTWENTRGDAGVKLNYDISNIQRFARGRGQRLLDEKLSKYFKRLKESIIDRALSTSRRVYGVRSEVRLTQDQQASIWEESIISVLAVMSDELVLDILPAVQSVSSDAYVKVGSLLNRTNLNEPWQPLPAFRSELNQRVNEVASGIRGINETTERRIKEVVAGSIQLGFNQAEVANSIRDANKIGESRIATISRTEMGKASDLGTKLSMKHAGSVSHLSVFGCAGVEIASPHIDGNPTCNISNVPIWRERELVFHPNHTGVIFASGFYLRDGSPPPLVMEAFPYTGPARVR